MTRRTLIIAGAGCLALLGAWFLLFWSPSGTDLAAANERVVEADRQSDALELRLSQLLDAQRRLGELTETEGRYSTAIPDEPRLAEFLLDAHAIAEKAGIDFLEINPAPPSASTTPGVGGEIRLGFRVDGGYFHVLDYLDALLDMPRLVVLDSITLAPGGQGPQEGALSVSLSGRMFTSVVPGAEPVQDTVPTSPPDTVPTAAPDTVAATGTTPEGGA